MKAISWFLVLIAAFTIAGCVDDVPIDETREDFLGNWTCTEYEGEFAPQTYNVEVVAYGSGSAVRIYGLYNQGPGFALSGSVSGSTIFIDNQTVNNITYSGFGNINNDLDRVDLNFSAYDGSTTDDVKAAWLR